jgi:N-acyl-phosphatidylethanolamine-hydrolysing phospholipase D
MKFYAYSRKGILAPWGISLLIGASALGCKGILPPPAFNDQAWIRESEQLSNELLYADHFKNGKYDNPWRPNKKTFFTFLRWKFSRPSRDYGPPGIYPIDVVPNDGSYLQNRNEPPSITSVGHATFVIQLDGQVWVTDPMFSDRALWPRREVDPAIPITAIPENALAIISHNHYDHLDIASIRAMPASTRWFVPLGLKKFFEKRGIRQVEELDWWDSVQVGDTTLVCLPAQHWSNRMFTGRNTTLWAAWILITPERKIYFGGDSGYFNGFEEIGNRYGPIDEPSFRSGLTNPDGSWPIAT